MPSLQETFDIVVTNLRRQGCRSEGSSPLGKACLYRGPNDTKCAAGHLIPDDQYDPKMENTMVQRNTMVGQCILAMGYNLTFVGELQNIHDYDDIGSWELRWERLAQTHDLFYTPPEKPSETTRLGGLTGQNGVV